MIADLALAREAVLEAGRAIRPFFGAQLRVSYKSRDQPVTEADLLADRLLHARLLDSRPGYGWLSEETADSRDRLRRTRVWVVDPIDGTNAFVAGIGQFVVSVGLVEDGVPIVAALYNPITDELYEAFRGGGAMRNGEAIEVAAADGPPILLASRWEIEAGILDPYRESFRVEPMGSTAYRMLKVADGTGHASLSPAWKSEWDVCAAALVVVEAGGVVSQGDGSALRFNREDPVIPGIKAYSRFLRME